jgi:hypothetical protein
MKKQYTQPELYVENVVVESGIAVSQQWINSAYDEDYVENANGDY